MNYRQVACQQETMIGLEKSSDHADFSKDGLALREEQRCLNTWSALKTNIDWPLLGS